MPTERTDAASQKEQTTHILDDWKSREFSSILLREVGGIEGVPDIIEAPKNILKTIMGSRRTLHRAIRGVQKPWLKFLNAYGAIPTEHQLTDARNIASAFCSQSSIRRSILRQQIIDVIDTIGERAYYAAINSFDGTGAYDFHKEFDAEAAIYDGWASYSAWRSTLHPDIAALMSKRMGDKNSVQDFEGKYFGVFEISLSVVMKGPHDERQARF